MNHNTPTTTNTDRCNWFTSKAKIIYNPPRGKMKNKIDWWAIAEVDKQITAYYRWWVKKQYWIDLIPPSWDAHISIIRGEKPLPELMHLWEKYDKQVVDFKYQHLPQRAPDKLFWFVEVECPFLKNIRKELNRPFDWPLHITIGKQRY